jgi:hypothetical protein
MNPNDNTKGDYLYHLPSQGGKSAQNIWFNTSSTGEVRVTQVENVSLPEGTINVVAIKDGKAVPSEGMFNAGIRDEDIPDILDGLETLVADVVENQDNFPKRQEGDITIPLK